jgi:recombinational DNA repair ATPase RecF
MLEKSPYGGMEGYKYSIAVYRNNPRIQQIGGGYGSSGIMSIEHTILLGYDDYDRVHHNRNIISKVCSDIKKYVLQKYADGGMMAKGGSIKKKRTRFVDKVDAIADRLEGTKVPKRLKKDYGGRYNREEAEEAGRRIAGAQLRDEVAEAKKKGKRKRF